MSNTQKTTRSPSASAQAAVPARKGVPGAPASGMVRVLGRLDKTLGELPVMIGAQVLRAVATAPAARTCGHCAIGRADWDAAHEGEIRLAQARWQAIPEDERPEIETLLPEELRTDWDDPLGRETGRMPVVLAGVTMIAGWLTCELHVMELARQRREGTERAAAAGRHPSGAAPQPGAPDLLVVRPGADLNATAREASRI